MVAEKFNINCSLMGQGDNQVLICKYPKSIIDIKSTHEIFMHRLERILETIGPPLKARQTWVSSKFFIYGKVPILEGTPLGLSQKKLSRANRLTNEDFQNLESTLSSIAANSSAASTMDEDPVIPYLMGVHESIGALWLHLNHPFYGPSMTALKSSEKMFLPTQGKAKTYKLQIQEESLHRIYRLSYLFIKTLLSYPYSLGRFPIIQLVDLISHGFPDTVSLNLWGLRTLYFRLTEKDRILKSNILKIGNSFMNPDINPQLICEDPVSLNLLHGLTGSDKLKTMVHEFLLNMDVTNEVFKEFMIMAQRKQVELVNLLFEMTPFNPRVASTLMSSTIVGRANQIVRKINKTGTIISLMLESKEIAKRKFSDQLNDMESLDDMERFRPLRNRPQDLVDLYWKFEKNYFLGLIFNLTQNRSYAPEIWSCSRSRAQTLRVSGWKRPITGVSVAIPGEMFTWEPSSGEDCEYAGHDNLNLGYILLRHCLNRAEYRKLFEMDVGLGPFKPFFGAATKNKVKYEGGANVFAIFIVSKDVVYQIKSI